MKATLVLLFCALSVASVMGLDRKSSAPDANGQLLPSSTPATVDLTQSDLCTNEQESLSTGPDDDISSEPGGAVAMEAAAKVIAETAAQTAMDKGKKEVVAMIERGQGLRNVVAIHNADNSRAGPGRVKEKCNAEMNTLAGGACQNCAAMCFLMTNELVPTEELGLKYYNDFQNKIGSTALRAALLKRLDLGTARDMNNVRKWPFGAHGDAANGLVQGDRGGKYGGLKINIATPVENYDHFLSLPEGSIVTWGLQNPCKPGLEARSDPLGGICEASSSTHFAVKGLGGRVYGCNHVGIASKLHANMNTPEEMDLDTELENQPWRISKPSPGGAWPTSDKFSDDNNVAYMCVKTISNVGFISNIILMETYMSSICEQCTCCVDSSSHVPA